MADTRDCRHSDVVTPHGNHASSLPCLLRVLASTQMAEWLVQSILYTSSTPAQAPRLNFPQQVSALSSPRCRCCRRPPIRKGNHGCPKLTDRWPAYRVLQLWRHYSARLGKLEDACPLIGLSYTSLPISRLARLAVFPTMVLKSHRWASLIGFVARTVSGGQEESRVATSRSMRRGKGISPVSTGGLGKYGCAHYV